MLTTKGFESVKHNNVREQLVREFEGNRFSRAFYKTMDMDMVIL